MLENYCLQWDIKGKKWYEDDWVYGNLDKDRLEEINQIRKEVVEPIIKLKNQLIDAQNVNDMSIAIYNFLINQNIFSKVRNKIKQLKEDGKLEVANDYNTSIKILVEVLDEMVVVFQNEKMSIEKYRECLKVGLDNKDLGAIPGVQDEVIIGDIDRSRSHKIKAAFIIGINDGSFPSIRKDEGFLDDIDRESLKAEDIYLAKNTMEQLYYEQFNIYKALSVTEEKLYLSYTSTDNDGKSIRPSMLITNIKKMFPKLVEKSDIICKDVNISMKKPTFDALLEQIYKWSNEEKIDDVWIKVYNFYINDSFWGKKLKIALNGLKYTNLPEKIEKRQIDILYGNKIQTSISQLEQYRKCPFSYHLKYGLKLQESITSSIKPIDTGNFMHEVIDTFFDQIKRDKIEIQDITDDMLKNILEDIIDKKLQISKYYILTRNAKFRALIRKLKKTVMISMKYIVSQLKNSKFNVIGCEISFKNHGDYPPIMVELDENKKLEIVGKIDRVDLAENEDGKFIRIIDYKSSVKKIDLNEVIYGLQIQLITYLDKMTEAKQAESAGVLYFNLINSLINTKKRLTEEELEAELKKRYKMQGIVVTDIKVIKMMDNNLKNGYSDVIPVYIDTKGEISEKSSNTISKEDFLNLQKQVLKTIKQISSEILSGDISIKPYYNKEKKTGCDFCTYRSICNFNTKNKGNTYSFIPNMSKGEVLEKLRNSQEGTVDNV